MTFGPTFMNPFGVAVDAPVSTLTSDEALAEAVREIESLVSSFPAVLWVARSVTLTVPAIIPRNASLSFAPGAVLTLSGNMVLTLNGSIDAGLERRFILGSDAKVVFNGPLDEIPAAWWAEEPSSTTGNLPSGAAVRHALDVLWHRYLFDLESAPIMLAGPYFLEDTLRIAPPPELVARALPHGFDVVLRGRHFGPADPMTFIVKDAAKVGMESMLAADGRVFLAVENVGFDLRRSPGRSRVNNALHLTGYHDRSRIEGCYFKLAASTGIRLSNTLSMVYPLPRFVFGDGPDPAQRVDVLRCVFEGAEPTSVGVRSDHSAQTFLWVVDSQFRGTYGAGIAFVGSELTVTACTFDNAAQTGAASSHEIADIYLGSLEPVPDSGKDRTPDDPSDDHPVNAHLTVVHCVSTSVTFLVGEPLFAVEEPGGAVLTNVLHQPLPSDAESGACSIRWGGRYESRSLVLQGCEFGAPVYLANPVPLGVVVDLGTTFSIVAGERRPYIGGGPRSVASLSTPPA